MEPLLFIGISILEYIGALVAMLAIFRYPIKYYWPQLIFTSIICSMASHLLMIEFEVVLAPIIQIFVLAICFWLMFYTSLMWSLIISITYITAFAVLQGVILWSAMLLGFITPDFSKTGIEIYSVQIFTALACAAIGYYLTKKRYGFVFVPTSRDVPYKWSKTGIKLAVLNVCLLVILSVFYFFMIEARYMGYTIVLMILTLLFLVLLYIMQIKNGEYVDEPTDN